MIPSIKKVIRPYRNLSLPELKELLYNPYHEVRLASLYILVYQYQKKNANKRELYSFYLKHSLQVNNWDLVDASAHKIVGDYVYAYPEEKKTLYHLSESKVLWQQRIAVIATFALLRKGQYDELITLCTKFLYHPHDLIHKATGWMLREAGKSNIEILRGFLNQYASSMPRTMLRYAI